MPLIKFERTIRRSGGSAAVAIPPEMLKALNWKIGNTVEMYIENQTLVITRKSNEEEDFLN